MSDQNRPQVYLSADVEATGWEVGRIRGDVVLSLRQQGSGYMSVKFTPAQAHEVGKLLLIPDSRDRAAVEVEK